MDIPATGGLRDPVVGSHFASMGGRRYGGRFEIFGPKRLFLLEFTTAAKHRKMPAASGVPLFYSEFHLGVASV